MILKRIIVSERDSVLVQDLKIFLRKKGDSLNLLAPTINGSSKFKLETLCNSSNLISLITNGILSLYDENGNKITGEINVMKSLGLATLKEAGMGGDESISKRLIQESFVLEANGVTTMSLSTLPLFSDGVVMFVNGTKQVFGEDFTVEGTSITWTGFPLVKEDNITFIYEKKL